MADNWQILEFIYLRGEMSFNSKSRRLQVLDEHTGEMSECALSDVSVIFVGVGVRLAASVLYHLASYDVVVVCTDWKGQPVCAMYPWVGAHSRVAARQRAQAVLSLPRKKNAWMRIVKAKIHGQANNLRYTDSPEAKRIFAMCSAVRSGDPSNVEAQAAKQYWSALFQGEGFVRRPGQREPGRNSLLDYGYTILRGYSIRALLSAGLFPTLGVYHKGRSNSFALADDLIEPFRPVIDLKVKLISADSKVDDSRVRRGLIEATLSPFDNSGRSVYASMVDLAQQFGRYVEGEIQCMSVPFWDPMQVCSAQNV